MGGVKSVAVQRISWRIGRISRLRVPLRGKCAASRACAPRGLPLAQVLERAGVLRFIVTAFPTGKKLE